MSLGDNITEKILIIWDYMGMLFKLVSFGLTFGYIIGLLYVFILWDSPYLFICLLVWPLLGVCYLFIVCLYVLVLCSVKETLKFYSFYNSCGFCRQLRPSLIQFFLITFISATKKFLINVRENEDPKKGGL